MCNNFPNIRITEGNNFSLILPLRSRTYVATRPIDEDIDPAQLENVVVTFGGVEYPAQITAQGVQIDLPATLAVGTYNILLTADYLGSTIRAAYESAVTIVPWSAQSTAEQYITGSPVTLRAAYVLSGAMTDAELEALKQEYREKNAQLDEAIAEYERRAAELDGVAQEATLTQGVQDIRADISHIDIDTTTLAKEATLEAVSGKIGTPAQGQPGDLFAAIAQGGGGGGGIPVVQMTETTATIEPNKLYIWDEVAALDITLAAPTDPSIVNEYMAMFGVGSVLPTLTLPSAIEVRGEMDYNKTMCLSVINNIAYLS